MTIAPTLTVVADFEFDTREYTAHGSWSPPPAVRRCSLERGHVTVHRVVVRNSGLSLEPIEGGGLHRAAAAALEHAVRYGRGALGGGESGA